MDTILFDLFDYTVPDPHRKPLPLPTTQASRSTCALLFETISEGVKSCLPRRVHEPTGPLTVLLDMLLSIFVGHGACKSVIERLPLEVVGGSAEDDGVAIPVNAGEKCAICLGPYEEGDTVRHLGCSHAFHAECVDVWLEKKSLCPVCKADAC